MGEVLDFRAVCFTALVLFLLILAGPVDALYLHVDGLKNTPYSFGEKISFIGSIEIGSNERISLQNISIEINEMIACTTDVLGNEISECSGINVEMIGSANFGYGFGANFFERGWNGGNSSSNAGNYTGTNYGYGYGYTNTELRYNVTIDTPRAYLNTPGNNDIKLIALSNEQTFNSRIERVVLQRENSNSGSNGNGRGNGGRGNGGVRIIPNTNSNNANSDNEERVELKPLSNPTTATVEEKKTPTETVKTKEVINKVTGGDIFWISFLACLLVLCVLAIYIKKKRSAPYVGKYYYMRYY